MGLAQLEDGVLQEASESKALPGIPLTRVLIAIWVRRLLVVRVGCLGLVIGCCIAFLLPNRYTSSASPMPPDASSLTQQSAINMTGSLPVSFGASLASQRTPGATVIGLLNSRSEQDALIQRFDLLRVYHTASYEVARQKLTDISVFEEDKKSGIVTIRVTGDDRVRARDMAQAYIDELNRLLNQVSTSSAGKEHAFLAARLTEIKAELDRSSAALSTFSSRHETLNPASQGAAMIQSQAMLKEQIGAAQSELAAQQAIYTDRNVRVLSARARLGTLRAQLHEMDANPAADGATTTAGAPSLRQLPLLAVTYADLSRQVATQQAIYETLLKQLEIAKVQEAKELPAAKELDAPVLAETHSSPHRMVIILSGFLLGVFGALAYLASTKAWGMVNGHYGVSSYLSGLTQSERALHGRT